MQIWFSGYQACFLFLLQFLNRENNEPIVVKDRVDKPEAVQPSPIQNQLPQSQTEATSVLTTTPAKPQTGYRPHSHCDREESFAEFRQFHLSF